MKTIIWFQMTKKDRPTKCVFQGDPSDEQINEKFEEQCGGVYKWWREKDSDCDASEVNLY